jgi:hypothetical protein
MAYNRQSAVDYARKWAFGRNPAYLNFDKLGGDCTNFSSQCLFAGAKVMNFTPVFGWYYKSPTDRTPSWTGVQYLYDFLIKNIGPGPYGVEVPPEYIEPGDLVQLGKADGTFYHSPFVVAVESGEILLAAHSFDSLDRPLSTYVYERARFLHIESRFKY